MTAYHMATDKAIDRYRAMGRQLTFGADIEREWDEGVWENAMGLTYSYNETENTVEVVSEKLYSGMDFDPSGMMYCDLLSPYRALEWIYSTSLRKGYAT